LHWSCHASAPSPLSQEALDVLAHVHPLEERELVTAELPQLIVGAAAGSFPALRAGEGVPRWPLRQQLVLVEDGRDADPTSTSGLLVGNYFARRVHFIVILRVPLTGGSSTASGNRATFVAVGGQEVKRGCASLPPSFQTLDNSG
jgi:hypothetical protein